MYVLLCILLISAADEALRWPSFLGMDASALSADTLPLTWSPNQNIAWTADVPGDGQSSPVIWGEQVFVTSVEGPMKDNYHVLAFRLSDGQLLWKHTLPNSAPVKSDQYVSRAAPTPVTDGQALYVFFESGDTLALSCEGEVLWQRSLSKDHGPLMSNHGLAASPLLTDNGLILLVDHQGPSYLLSLDKQNGSELWKTERSSRTSWSSPALMPIGTQHHIVCSSAGSVDGYDPQDGKLLWSFDEVEGNTIASPKVATEGTFLIGAGSGRDSEKSSGNRTNGAFEVQLVEGKPVPRILWRAKKATTSFGSPIVFGNEAYWVNASGVVFCFDAETGQSRYTKRLSESCWATPLGTGDRVYFFGKNGATTVLRAGSKYEVLAKNQLWSVDSKPETKTKPSDKPAEGEARPNADFGGPIQYGVAAVNGSLVIRTGNKLYCVRP